MKSIAQIFFSRRMAIMLFLGFTAGLPLALTKGTLQAWLATEKVDIKTIGLFNLVALPYTWKFIWAPGLDRFHMPFLGRRRGWMLVSQILLVLAIAGMAFTNPAQNITLLGILAVLVAFSSSSQDIVIDAYRTELLSREEYGAGAGIYVTGYRLAMLVSGAFALILSSHMTWRDVYLLMAGLMVIGIVTTLLAPEAKDTRPVRSLMDAVVLPFRDFFGRPYAIEILIFILLYKLDSGIASALMTAFFIDVGFERETIGYVFKIFGLIATIAGGLIGGAMIPYLGLRRALFYFGILQGATNLLFYYLAKVGPQVPALIAVVAGENLAGGLGTAAYAALLMSLCNQQFTATQYALLTSLMAVPGSLIASSSGFLQASLGWERYFVFATLIAIPGILMSLRYPKWSENIRMAQIPLEAPVPQK